MFLRSALYVVDSIIIIIIIIIILFNAKVAFPSEKSRHKVYRLHKGAQIQVHLMFKIAYSCCSECMQLKISNMDSSIRRCCIIGDKTAELCYCKLYIALQNELSY